jgi:hypothetical protein
MDQGRSYSETIVNTWTERIYGSHPLALADGDRFTLESMSVKICDFGYGIFICDLS